MTTYPIPPIISAVIDVRFSNSLSERDVERLSQKLAKSYPVKKHYIQGDVEFMITSEGNIAPSLSSPPQRGYRIETVNADEQLIFTPLMLAGVKLPLYTHWDNFCGSYLEAWGALEKVAGKRNITRIATKYVNRIDVPTTDDNKNINIADYLNVGVNSPEDLMLEGYEAAMGVLLQDGFKAIVRTSTGKPEVPNTLALFLDIDVFSEQTLPHSTKELRDSLKKLQSLKNSLFEKFITDKSRALFGKH